MKRYTKVSRVCLCWFMKLDYTEALWERPPNRRKFNGAAGWKQSWEAGGLGWVSARFVFTEPERRATTPALLGRWTLISQTACFWGLLSLHTALHRRFWGTAVVSCNLELRGRNAVPTGGGPTRAAGPSRQHPCLLWQESSENSKLGPSKDRGLDWTRNWLSDFSNPHLGGFNMQLGLQSRGRVGKIHVFSFTF